MVSSFSFGILKKLLACFVLFISLLIAQPLPAAARSIYPSGKTGNDVSWPPSNCIAAPTAIASFGIVGVTGGLNFTQNPCLFRESHQFNQLSLYINTGYPGQTKAAPYIRTAKKCSGIGMSCQAYNYGYAAAEYALLYADSQNVATNTWWLDVETENSWSDNPTENRSSIQGAIDAINHGSIFRPNVGIYSTPHQWKEITGDWKNQLPAWIGTGSSERQDAISACSDPPFTGGTTELTQYVLDVDHDYSC